MNVGESVVEFELHQLEFLGFADRTHASYPRLDRLSQRAWA